MGENTTFRLPHWAGHQPGLAATQAPTPPGLDPGRPSPSLGIFLMSISFSCTGCGRTLKVADELAGRKAKCPQCQTVLYIPEGPAVAMTPAPMPAGRRAAAAPPQEEYDDPAGLDRGEELEGGPRRRRKAKKSSLVPVLLVGGAVVLVLLVSAPSPPGGS